MNLTLAMMLAALAGVCIALQAAANSRLRQLTEQPFWATYFSILGTMIFATLTMLALRPALPSMETLRQTPWWAWIGGPLGALIVLSGTFLVKDLGAARFIASVVAGQLLASLLLDHFGAMGLTTQPLAPGKVLGALLIIAGVVCMKLL